MRAALFLVLIVLVSACGPNLSPSAAVSPSAASPARIVPPTITPPPVSPPTPPGNALPNFVCADAGGGKVGVANAITARVGEQPGFDRFVLQFDSIMPQYTVKRQSRPVFTLGGSGQTVTLQGTAGVLVVVHSANGASTFVGPTDLTPGYLVLREARQVEDYEGYFGWGLGLSRPACMRVFVLQDPARLVVDFQTTTS